MKHNLEFDTQYNQFYLFDKNSSFNTNSTEFWTDEAYIDRIAIEVGVLGIGTECYGPVKADLIIRETANENFDLKDFDHIVEAGLKINSGTLQILDCPNSSVEFEIELEPGEYKARIYSSNLASVDGDEGNDFYNIEIWPENDNRKNVLKRYK